MDLHPVNMGLFHYVFIVYSPYTVALKCVFASSQRHWGKVLANVNCNSRGFKVLRNHEVVINCKISISNVLIKLLFTLCL